MSVYDYDGDPVIDDLSGPPPGFDVSGGNDFQFPEPDYSWLNEDPIVLDDESDSKVSRRARLRRNILSEENDVGRETLNFGDKALLGASRLATEVEGGIASGIGNIASAAEGLASVANPRTRKFTGSISRAARRKAQEYKDESRTIDVDEEDFDWPSFIGGTLGSVVPTVGAGILGTLVGGPGLGLAAAIGAGGAMSGGATFQAARERFKANGDDDRTSDLKALPIGIASGLITALITRGFGATGVEAIANGLTRSTLRQAARNLAKHGGMEGLEEELDQYGQGFLEKLTFNPQKKIEDIATEAGLAFVGGALAGTTVTGLREVGGRIIKGIQEGPKDGRTMEEVLPLDERNADLPEYFEGAPSRSSRRANRPIIGTPLEQVMAELPVVSRRGRRLERGQVEVPESVNGNVNPDPIIEEQVSVTPQRTVSRLQRQSVPLDPVERAQLQAQEPTEAQQEAGNFKKSHVNIDGLDVAIERVRGSIRTGKDKGGNEWQVTMPADYGYVKGTKGKDGDNVDLYIGQQLESPIVFVVDQIVPETGKFDEHKAMYGFGSEQEALATYDTAFSDGNGPARRGAVTPLTKDQFKEWLDSGKTKQPLSYEGGESNAKETSQANQGQQEGLLNSVPAPVTGAQVAPVTPVPPVVAENATTQPEPIPQTEKARMPKEKKVKTPKVPEPAVIPGAPVDKTKKTKAPWKPGKQAVQYDDAIQWIQDNVGKISTKSQAGEADRPDYTDEYRQALKYKHIARLFGKGGKSASTVVDDMRRAGYVGDDFTAGDLWPMLLSANKARRGKAGITEEESAVVSKSEQATERFQSIALDNKRSVVNKQKSKAQAIPVDELGYGDTLEIAGEKFTVSGMHFDADNETLDFLELSDGRKFGVQTVAGSQVIYPDPDTLVKKEPEFLPPDEEFDRDEPQQNRESIGPTIQLREGGPVVTERSGIQNLRGMVERSALPVRTKQTIIAFLEQPLMRDLDWSGLQVDLTNFIEDGVTGQQLGRIITLSTEAGADVFPHEVAHVMHYFLPDAERAELSRQRQEAIKRKYGNNPPPGLLEGFGSSKFQAAGLPIEDYPLINDSEFFADFIGNRFAEQAFLDRNGKTLWTKLRAWVQAMVDTLRRRIGLTPGREQMFRQMMAGVYKPDIQAIIDLEKKFSFSRTAKRSQEIEQFTKGTAQQATEATHQLAQGYDFVELLTKHGAGGASSQAQSHLRFWDYLTFRGVGERLNNGVSESYRQLKGRLGDYQKRWMAVIAGEQMASFDKTLDQVQEDARKATERLQSPQFMNKLQRDAKRKQNLDTAEAVNRAAGPILESALRLAQKALKEESRNDTEIAQIEAQLREIDEVRKSSSAMSQLLADMVDVISYSGAGKLMLQNPVVTRNELLDEYTSVKHQTNQPLHNPTLLKWASFILARNAELRDTLHAAQLARNSNIRAGMGAYEIKLMADLERNFVQTMMRERGLAKKLQSAEDKARFAWWKLHSDLMEELNSLMSQVEAGTIASNVQTDPDYVTLRKEMFTDAGILGRGAPLAQFRDKVLLLPDGTTVDISTGAFQGTKVPQKMWAEWEKARNDLRTWLENPANMENPDYDSHMRSLQALEEHYYNESILSPHDKIDPFGDPTGITSGFLDTLFTAAERAGGRLSASVKKSISKWGFLKGQAGNWRQEWSAKLTAQRLKTLDSHGIKHNKNGGKQSFENANTNFFRDHLNQVIYSLNRQAGGMKVGDRTKNGTVVTQEDLNDAKLQSHMASLGYKIVEQNFGGKFNIVVDKRSGVTLQRRPSKGTEYFVPRMFERELSSFIQDFDAARKEKNDQAMIDLLNKPNIWNKVFYGFVWDRNQDYATPTPFDGPGNAFDLAAQQHGSITNFQDFVNFLVSNSSATPAEAQAIVLTEMGNQISALAEEESDVIVPPVTGETSNSFSRGRGNAVAPFGFYRYGFESTPDVTRFSGMVHSQALDEVLNGMNGLKKDIEDRIAELGDRAKQIGLSAALSERARDVKNGDNYDHYRHLSAALKNIQSAIDDLSLADPQEQGDFAFRRITGGVIGGMLQNIATTIRNLVGFTYLGSLAMRLNARSGQEYLPAFWYGFIQNQALAFGHAIAGVTRGAARTVPGTIKGIHDALTPGAKGKRFKTLFSESFAPFLYETSAGIINHWKTLKEMQDRGLIAPMDLGLEWKNRIMAGFASAGTIGAQEMTAAKRFSQGAIGLAEMPFMFVKGLFPTIGDYGMNVAIYKTMLKSPVGHKTTMQAALYELYKAWQASGQRQFNFQDIKDPVNRLSARELFPSGFTQGRVKEGSQEEMDLVSSWYEQAGLSLQEEAMKYLKQLHDNVPKPEFLTGDSETLFVNEQLAALNKATVQHTPLLFESSNKILQLIRPLMSWRMRTLNSTSRMLSVNSKSDQARMAQWAAVATMVLLPMLLSGAAKRVVTEEEIRKLFKWLYGQERGTKQPFEREGLKSQVLGWSSASTDMFPFIDILFSTLVDDLPTRATLEPSFVMLDKAKQLSQYIGGMIQTGDPTFNLARTIVGFVPESRIITSRLESETGKRLGSDVVALVRRAGPEDILKPYQQTFGGIRSELSPYGEAMENAALNGDFKELKRLSDEAIKLAKQMGKEKPEQTIHQAYQARNPFQRPLKVKMSDAQMAKFRSRLSPDELSKVEQAEARYKHGAAVIGANVYVTKEESPRYGGSSDYRGVTGSLSRRRRRLGGRISRNRVGRVSRRGRRVRR